MCHCLCLFGYDNLISEYQWVEKGEKFERFAEKTKRKFLSKKVKIISKSYAIFLNEQTLSYFDDQVVEKATEKCISKHKELDYDIPRIKEFFLRCSSKICIKTEIGFTHKILLILKFRRNKWLRQKNVLIVLKKYC